MSKKVKQRTLKYTSKSGASGSITRAKNYIKPENKVVVGILTTHGLIENSGKPMDCTYVCGTGTIELPERYRPPTIITSPQSVMKVFSKNLHLIIDGKIARIGRVLALCFSDGTTDIILPARPKGVSSPITLVFDAKIFEALAESDIPNLTVQRYVPDEKPKEPTSLAGLFNLLPDVKAMIGDKLVIQIKKREYIIYKNSSLLTVAASLYDYYSLTV